MKLRFRFLFLLVLVSLLLAGCDIPDGGDDGYFDTCPCPCPGDVCTCEYRLRYDAIWGAEGNSEDVKLTFAERLSLDEPAKILTRCYNGENKKSFAFNITAPGFVITDEDGSSASDGNFSKTYKDVMDVRHVYDTVYFLPTADAPSSGEIHFDVVGDFDPHFGELNGIRIYYAKSDSYVAYSVISAECAQHLVEGKLYCRRCVCDEYNGQSCGGTYCPCFQEAKIASTYKPIAADEWTRREHETADLSVTFPSLEEMDLSEKFRLLVDFTVRKDVEDVTLTLSSEDFSFVFSSCERGEGSVEKTYPVVFPASSGNTVTLEYTGEKNARGAITVTLSCVENGEVCNREVKIFYKTDKDTITLSKTEFKNVFPYFD